MKVPDYITQLSRRDLEEIACAANMSVEEKGGLVLQRIGDRYVLTIDRSVIANIVQDTMSNIA